VDEIDIYILRDILLKAHEKIIIKTFLIVAIIFILLRKINLEELFSYLLYADKKMFFLAFVMACIMCGILALKWKILLKDTKFIRLLEGVLISHILTYSLGGQIVGEGGKIVLLKKSEENIQMVAVSVLVDKITGFLGVFIAGFVGMIFSRISLPIEYKILYCLIIGGCACLIIGVFNQKSLIILISFSNKLKKRNGILGKCGKIFENVLSGIGQYVNDKKVILISIAWGIILQIVSVSVSFCICCALGIVIYFQDLCWIISLVSVIALIPLSVMGIGVSQVSTISLLMLSGISKELATGYSLVLYFVMIGVAVLSMVLLAVVRFYREV